MIIQSGATYRLEKTKKAGRLIELGWEIVNPKHPRVGDWIYRCANPGQRRRQGIISVRELERSWEVLLCRHRQSPEFCTECLPICPFCTNDLCTCSEGS